MVNVDEAVLEPKRTWRDVLAGNRYVKNGLKLEYIPSDDSDVIEYTYEEVRSEIWKWQFSLIGAVIGPVVSFSTMERYVKDRWDMVETPEVRVTKSGVFMFTFKLDEDMLKVMHGGPWMFGGLYNLVLQIWRPLTLRVLMNWLFGLSCSI